eukprot:4717970-Prymnesium_polylepis.1
MQARTIFGSACPCLGARAHSWERVPIFGSACPYLGARAHIWERDGARAAPPRSALKPTSPEADQP